MDDNTPYVLGGLFGRFIVFPLIVFGIGYGLLRLIKKRKPTKKEKVILVVITIIITLFGIIGSAARRSNGL